MICTPRKSQTKVLVFRDTKQLSFHATQSPSWSPTPPYIYQDMFLYTLILLTELFPSLSFKLLLFKKNTVVLSIQRTLSGERDLHSTKIPSTSCSYFVSQNLCTTIVQEAHESVDQTCLRLEQTKILPHGAYAQLGRKRDKQEANG